MEHSRRAQAQEEEGLHHLPKVFGKYTMFEDKKEIRHRQFLR